MFLLKYQEKQAVLRCSKQAKFVENSQYNRQICRIEIFLFFIDMNTGDDWLFKKYPDRDTRSEPHDGKGDHETETDDL